MSTGSIHKYEVLRIRFIKTRNYNDSLALFRERKNQYLSLMCLGHFDFIEIKRDFEDSNRPLRIIEADQSAKDDKTNDNCIIYPHYLIKEAKENHSNNFWRGEPFFTSFIRIHCKKHNRQRVTLSEYLEDHLETNLNRKKYK